jgi:hypothetical protein
MFQVCINQNELKIKYFVNSDKYRDASRVGKKIDQAGCLRFENGISAFAKY